MNAAAKNHTWDEEAPVALKISINEHVHFNLILLTIIIIIITITTNLQEQAKQPRMQGYEQASRKVSVVAVQSNLGVINQNI